MAGSYVCDCTDWTITRTGDELVLRPSARTAGKRLIVTGIALVLMVMMVMTFGLPPGKAKLNRKKDRLAQIQRNIKKTEKLIATAQHIGGNAGRSQMQSYQATRQLLTTDRDRLRLQLSSGEPSLGPVADTVYWIVMGLLIALAVFAPISGLWESITLLPESGGGLSVRRRGQIVPSRSFPPGLFSRLEIFVQRVMVQTRTRYGRSTEDHGWRWRIQLFDRADGGAPILEIWPQQEPTLPPHVERLTARVRTVVELLEATTNLKAQPPITADVGEIEVDMFSTRASVRVRRHGPVTRKRYGTLDDDDR